eukprot:7502302-Alexandrium_andersonii.AAC.1
MIAALRNGALEGSGELWRALESSGELRKVPEGSFELRRALESLRRASGELPENWLKVTACDPAGVSQDHRLASLAG